MKMIHELTQGDSAWHQFRSQHFGASEAGAVLGMSPYKTRTELLNEKKTGIAKEVNAATQFIFNKGRIAEELARPIVENRLGVELYPVTMSYGKLSASCDGLSMDETIAWECKQFNKAHFEQVKNGELPDIHWPQCQQVLHVTGAEKLYFTISDGTEENTAGVWVYPDAEKIQSILYGWAQFDIDLENHVPTQAIEAPKAEAIMALPGLAIQIKGEVTLSNLPEFQKAATAFIANISTELVTDEDFVKAESVCKFCKDAEDNIDGTKASAIAQTQSIDELMRTLDFVKAQLRDKRLLLEKLVKSEKENRKMQIVNDALDAFTAHVQSHAPTRLQVTIPDFASATKNKKTLSSMKEAVNQLLVNSKIEIDALARDIKRKTDWFNDIAKDHIALFPDLQTIIYKENSDFQLLVNSRIKDFKLEEEKKLEAIKAQAALDAHAKLAQETNQKAPAEIAPVNHIVESNEMIETATPQTQYFYSNEPSVNEIVCAVAASFKVDEMQAHRWLINADFREFKKAA